MIHWINLFSWKVYIHLYGTAPTRNKSVYFVSIMSCPAHTVEFLLYDYIVISLTAGTILQNSEQVEIWGYHIKFLGWVAGKWSNHILWWLPKSSNLCTVLLSYAALIFPLDSCDAKIVWNASCVVLVFWCVRVDGLPSTSALKCVSVTPNKLPFS